MYLRTYVRKYVCIGNGCVLSSCTPIDGAGLKKYVFGKCGEGQNRDVSGGTHRRDCQRSQCYLHDTARLRCSDYAKITTDVTLEQYIQIGVTVWNVNRSRNRVYVLDRHIGHRREFP